MGKEKGEINRQD